MIEWKNELEYPLNEIDLLISVFALFIIVLIIFIPGFMWFKMYDDILHFDSESLTWFLTTSGCFEITLLMGLRKIFVSMKKLRIYTNTIPKDIISFQELIFISIKEDDTIFVHDADCKQKFCISGISSDELKQIQKYKNFVIKDGKIITLNNLTF